HIDGLENIISAFNKLICDFKRKGHDLLDDDDTAFERDFVEFTMNNSALENQVQSFIESRFNKVTKIEEALALLEKFRVILHRESLQNDLDNKYMQVFRSYGKQLEHIQQIFIKKRENPPLSRNMTKVAGCIQWSRQLLNRITGLA
ncbi:dynein gamma chain, flagellar outer arm, partial [Reticulomyxa filosa]